MEYTKLTPEYMQKYAEKFILDGTFKMKIAREDPVKFAYYFLGKRLWPHQTFLCEQALSNRKCVWCLPRQTGKSVTISVLAFWAAWFNQYGNHSQERLSSGTSIYIMSRTEDQAKELLLRIRDLIRDGDAHMSKLLKASKHNQHVNDFFSSQITEPNNVFQITFKNGSFIKCVPPTDSVRGKSADWFFIDEAAFLKTEKPDELFNEAIEPTISQTGGKMIISSTPKGQQGFFYKILDPFGMFVESDDYKKAWFHYEVIPSEIMVNEIREKEKTMRSEGNGKSFEQEYEAKFVANAESFFDSNIIDSVISQSHSRDAVSQYDCVLGVDYGMVHSRTALSISYLDSEGLIITCYVKRFQKGKDINDLIPFIQGLKERFHIVKIVADDCPEGFSPNQAMISKGWNVDLFNFTQKKSENYCSYRAKLNAKKVGILADKDLLMEMKGLQQEETINGKLKIYKGGGLTDDLCDALIMSASQWLSEDGIIEELFLV